MTALAVLFVLASGDLCASRSAQCLAACQGDAICVSKCTRYQATCEKNRDTQERIAMPKKCFDAMGSPLRCDVTPAKPPDVHFDPKQLEQLAKVASVTLTKPWKDEAKPRAKGKVIEVRQ